jgi:hypothetical protein
MTLNTQRSDQELTELTELDLIFLDLSAAKEQATRK